ncbi:MAG: copper chaperone PCu(A)C, partial [Candidatus Eisenbacteria bacterium]
MGGCTPTASREQVRIEQAWVRAADSLQTTAGYLTLVNDSGTDVVVLRATCTDAVQVQMHQTLHEGARVRMQETARLLAPAHGVLRFAPGGNHLMLVRLTHALIPGARAGLSLTFDDGRTLAVNAQVRP